MVGGETWEDITRNPGLPEGMLGKMGVSASPARSGRVWAIIEHKTGTVAVLAIVLNCMAVIGTSHTAAAVRLRTALYTITVYTL